MKTHYILFLLIVINSPRSSAQIIEDSVTYLNPIKTELQKKWPANRTINLVFHGHSVPSGYFKTPHVSTLDSYPYLTLKNVKDIYPHAVVNSITTSIGGEQSVQGARRFKEDVLSHRPDVLFIDYALNDRGISLKSAKEAWEKMIQEAIAYGTKVILLTPTPDLNEDIQSPNSPLAKHSVQIRQLAKKYKIGLVDSYRLFQEIAKTEELNTYMAQSNHINKKGHQVVAKAILDLFNSESK
ncbi:SGNH/GDSL hydrolase family protein [Arenibacter aquaticus]|uniref:SGNH/GDSL hydrolase family protein n=1 Tax=Arenibacter aquaticus TaxID=2489054 RepID=A0A3S0CPG8_9FLAO|nr:GDSL-type esterase/lipase family protein [Arenibacter aquaticus]RTE54190.1 SGNH/GDSL hydrolase family protein [Arenibacter aquaticus]